MPPPSGEQQKQPARSTPSSSRPAPLFIPASLSRLSFQVAPEPASPPDADGERWSDIPILLDDGGGPSLPPSAPCASQNTPRQILHFPTDVFVDDSDGAPLSSPHGACGTPRGLPTSRAAAGRAAVASSSVEPPTAEHLDPTCLLADTDAGSDSDSSSRSAPSMHVVSDDHGLADAAPAALSRRNRLAYGPEADLWRQCSLLRPVFEPSFPSGLGLFDPEYDLRRVVPAAASMQRGSSPFGTSIDDDDDQSEEILTVNEGRRCPSPLDSTYLAVLSRPPVNPDRALFNSEMAARSAAKGELRVLIWLEHDGGCVFEASLAFRKYSPPTDLASPAVASADAAQRDRFARTGSVEYGVPSGARPPSWKVQPVASSPLATMSVTKIALSDDDGLNFLAPSSRPVLPLHDPGVLEVCEADNSSPSWGLNCEVGVESSHTTVAVLSFQCDPSLLDRSRVAASPAPATRGVGFRLRLGSASDAPTRLAQSSVALLAPRRRLFSADSPPDGGRMGLTRSETHLPLPSSPSASTSAPLPTPSASFGGLFRKRSLSAARPPTSAPPTYSSRRSQSLRTASGPAQQRNGQTRSSAPLPFVPSSVGQPGPRVRSSPGQGLPPSAAAPPSPPRSPHALPAASSTRRPTTASPSKGASAGLGVRAKHLRRRVVTESGLA